MMIIISILKIIIISMIIIVFSIIITMQYDIGKHKQNAKHKQVSISLNIHNSGMHVSTVKKRKYRRTHDGNDNGDDDCDGDLRSPWIQQ